MEQMFCKQYCGAQTPAEGCLENDKSPPFVTMPLSTCQQLYLIGPFGWKWRSKQYSVGTVEWGGRTMWWVVSSLVCVSFHSLGFGALALQSWDCTWTNYRIWLAISWNSIAYIIFQSCPVVINSTFNYNIIVGLIFFISTADIALSLLV